MPNCKTQSSGTFSNETPISAAKHCKQCVNADSCPRGFPHPPETQKIPNSGRSKQDLSQAWTVATRLPSTHTRPDLTGEAVNPILSEVLHYPSSLSFQLNAFCYTCSQPYTVATPDLFYIKLQQQLL